MNRIKTLAGVAIMLAALSVPVFADGAMGTPPVAPPPPPDTSAPITPTPTAVADGAMGTPPVAVLVGESIIQLVIAI
jgi:hypothetical protein